jgi:hypothetical protein
MTVSPFQSLSRSDIHKWSYKAYFAETCDRQRIAATHSKVSSRRNAVELRLGVTKCFGNCAAISRLYLFGESAIVVANPFIDVAAVVHIDRFAILKLKEGVVIMRRRF